MRMLHVYVESGETTDKRANEVNWLLACNPIYSCRVLCVTAKSDLTALDFEYKNNAVRFGRIGASDMVVLMDGYTPDNDMLVQCKSLQIPIFQIKEETRDADWVKVISKMKEIYMAHEGE